MSRSFQPTFLNLRWCVLNVELITEIPETSCKQLNYSVCNRLAGVVTCSLVVTLGLPLSSEITASKARRSRIPWMQLDCPLASQDAVWLRRDWLFLIILAHNAATPPIISLSGWISGLSLGSSPSKYFFSTSRTTASNIAVCSGTRTFSRSLLNCTENSCSRSTPE